VYLIIIIELIIAKQHKSIIYLIAKKRFQSKETKNNDKRKKDVKIKLENKLKRRNDLVNCELCFIKLQCIVKQLIYTLSLCLPRSFKFLVTFLH